VSFQTGALPTSFAIPGAKWRGTVVRDRVQAESRPRTEPPPLGKANGSHSSQQMTVPVFEVAPGDPAGLRERRLSWAELMKRVFREDVLRCKKCGGRAAVISAIAQPAAAEGKPSKIRQFQPPQPARLPSRPWLPPLE